MFRLLRPPTTVYPLAFITFLCTASYFLGIYLHARGNGPRPNSTTITSIPCRTFSNSHSSSVELDFSSHHSADDLVKLTSRTFPSCDAKYSEYTPCEDRDRSLGFPRDRLIYRERHCPRKNELLKCLVPAPFGYRSPFHWPVSRDRAWFANVPHKELTVEKAGQNWIRVDGKIFRFPGGGTMFPRGADAYIDEIAELVPLKDGSIRTAVDTGCGVASFGAYLMPRNITTMSFAPRDTHEAQVQFALERGVPAIIGVIASIRLPYPSKAVDLAHCSRCLIPWHFDNGQYLIEVDRILRPGGYWILSGPPINWQAHWKGWNRTRDDLKAEQDAIEAVAARLCWKKLKQKGDIAVWQKPINHMECKGNPNAIRFCPAEQDSDKAWYTKLNTCITPLPEVNSIQEPAGGKLKNWPERLTAVPPRIQTGSLEGITPAKFLEDSELWKKRVRRYKSLNGNLVDWSYRNILDMNSYLGGFAAVLASEPVWVMNVVPTAGVDTLGVVYQRGLIGTYQDWCEAMSTYPRTYDLIHANAVFTLYQNRCEIEDILLEMDRILRPEGAVIFRDDVDVLMKVKTITDGMKWETQFVDHEDGPLEREKILMAKKQYWTLPKTL